MFERKAQFSINSRQGCISVSCNQVLTRFSENYHSSVKINLSGGIRCTDLSASISLQTLIQPSQSSLACRLDETQPGPQL